MVLHARRLRLALFALVLPNVAPAFAAAPRAGELAPEFALKTLGGETISLQQQVAARPVVLVVLRGWPGYQCPICTKQVHDFVGQAAQFREAGAQVLMVYPGPAEQLQAHAREFLEDKQWPADFLFVADPNYTFTNAYGLRWDAPNETAYPSTFVVDRTRTVRFAKVSKSHGDRANVAELVAALRALSP